MTATRTAAAQYRVGETFTCIKRRWLDIAWTEQSEPCGAEIVIHQYHWCAQICPKCLANYFVGFGSDMGLYLDTAGFLPGRHGGEGSRGHRGERRPARPHVQALDAGHGPLHYRGDCDRCLDRQLEREERDRCPLSG